MRPFKAVLLFLGSLFIIIIVVINQKCFLEAVGWHGGAVLSNVASRTEGCGFDPRLCVRSFYRAHVLHVFCMFSPGFSNFLKQSNHTCMTQNGNSNLEVGVSMNAGVWPSMYLVQRVNLPYYISNWDTLGKQTHLEPPGCRRSCHRKWVDGGSQLFQPRLCFSAKLD